MGISSHIFGISLYVSEQSRPIHGASEPRVAAWEASDEVHGAGLGTSWDR